MILILLAVALCTGGCWGSGLDLQPPSWQFSIGIKSASPHEDSVTITWGAATDTKSPPVIYLIYKDTDNNPWDQIPIEVTSNTHYEFTGLDSSTKYWFGVRCRDSAEVPNMETNNIILPATPWGSELPTDITQVVATSLVQNCASFDVQDNYVYFNDRNIGFQIMDISDPLNPSLVSQMGIVGWDTMVDVRDNYAYLTMPGFRILDISNPLEPKWAGELFMVDYIEKQIIIRGNYAYILYQFSSSHGLAIVDISDPFSPQRISVYDLGYYPSVHEYSNFYDLALDGDYALITYASFVLVSKYNNSGVTIVDISDPYAPVSAGKPILFDDSFIADSDIAIYENYLLLTKKEEGLLIYDFSDLSNFVNVATLDTGTNEKKIDISSGYALVLSDDNLTCLNIQDPSNPVVIDSIPTSGDEIVDLKVDNEYAYVGYRTSGFYIFRFI
jgi:hypothetical protein